eukprot:c11451_g1_i1.p1 GENE.c11451_g1_i1~~c11451_g1_i1.p1  ORF type:complete len:149 (-),score=29.13 c11451_g1_i1:4-450(-)
MQILKNVQQEGVAKIYVDNKALFTAVTVQNSLQCAVFCLWILRLDRIYIEPTGATHASLILSFIFLCADTLTFTISTFSGPPSLTYFFIKSAIIGFDLVCMEHIFRKIQYPSKRLFGIKYDDAPVFKAKAVLSPLLHFHEDTNIEVGR